MAFIRAKFINGEYYFYLVESKRVGGRISQETIKYLGRRGEAEKYAQTHKLKFAAPPSAFPTSMETSLDRIIELKKKRLSNLRRNPIIERRLRNDIAVIWTYNSTAIEGSTLNLRETALLLQDGIASGNKALADYMVAEGHRDAVNMIYNFVENGQTINESSILALHKAVMKGIFDVHVVGKYRDVPVWIRGSSYIPPPPEQVPAFMKKLITMAKSNPGRFDPITLSAIVHLDFESVHPFADGNGRVGRLLSNWILMKHKYPPIIIENSEKKKYFVALENAQTRHDKSGLLRFFKKKVNLALDFHLEQSDPNHKKWTKTLKL
jgi:Fic family protein